jgi:hypothetical protein
MNTPDTNAPLLAPLRALPTEVSVDHVAIMVAAFPLAAASFSWIAYLNQHLNTLLMTTTGTLLLGTSLYLANAEAPALREVEAIAPATVLELAEVDAPLPEPAAVFDMPAQKPAVTPVEQAPVVITTALSGPQPAPPAPEPLATSAPTPATAVRSHGKRVFPFSGFTALTITGSLDVVVEQGPFAVEASGDEELLEGIHFEMGGKNLMLLLSEPCLKNSERGRDRARELVVTVRLPRLERLEILGSGSAVLDHFERGGDMAFIVRGSGDIHFTAITGLRGFHAELFGSGDITGGEVEVSGTTTIQLRGSGDVRLSGTTKRADIEVFGSGDVDASGLRSDDVKVVVRGSGDARVNSIGSLEQSIFGSGEIHNNGNAGRSRPRGVGSDQTY